MYLENMGALSSFLIGKYWEDLLTLGSYSAMKAGTLGRNFRYSSNPAELGEE
jgi:hypothetical protein